MDQRRFRDSAIEAIKARGWTMAEAARQTGVSYDVIRELHRRPDSTTSAENAAALISRLNLPIPSKIDPILSKALEMEGSQLERVDAGDAPPSDAALVPVYDVQASAGYGAVIGEEEQTHSLAFPPFYLRKIAGRSTNGLAVIGVKGDSMEPTLPDDSIVLIDTTKTHLGYDGLFVLQIDDVLHVKRVGRGTKPGHIMIISDNKDVHPAFERAISDVSAVGKVLWYGRKV